MTSAFASKSVDNAVSDGLNVVLAPFETRPEPQDQQQQDLKPQPDPRRPHPGPPAERFIHGRLASPKHIRVLLLSPSPDPTAPLSARMTQISLSKTWGRTKYETVSFPPCTQHSPIPLLVDGRAMDVSNHCDLALRHARDAEKERILWVAETCVDMEEGEEGGRLEELKKEVFRKQKSVITWTPPERKINNAYNYLLLDIVQGSLIS